MIVVDTNVIAYLYLPGEHTLIAEALLAHDPLSHWSRAERSSDILKPRSALRKFRRGRKRFVGVDHEHHQRVQVRRAAARDLHRHFGTMAGLGLTGCDAHHTARSTNALLAGEHVERFRARMAMHGRHAARRATGVVDAKQILGRSDTRNRLATGPSLK